MKARLNPAALRDRLVVPYRCTEGHEYPVRPTVSYDIVRKELTVLWPDGSRCYRFNEGTLEQCRGQLEPVITRPAARRGRRLARTLRDIWQGLDAGWRAIRGFAVDYPLPAALLLASLVLEVRAVLPA